MLIVSWGQIHHFHTVVSKRVYHISCLFIVNKTQSLHEQPPVSSVKSIYEGGSIDMNKYSSTSLWIHNGVLPSSAFTQKHHFPFFASFYLFKLLWLEILINFILFHHLNKGRRKWYFAGIFALLVLKMETEKKLF